MRALYNNYLILVFCLLLLSCQDNKIDKRLDFADSLLIENPDSVYRFLNELAESKSRLSRSQQMRYNMLLADAMNKAYVDMSKCDVMDEVVEYYDNHGTANEKMRAKYLLGCVYRDQGDAPKELECFHSAVQAADTTDKDCDFYTLSAIYGQMADVYQMQFLTDEEMKALKNSEICDWKAKDTVSALVAYSLRLRPFTTNRQSDSIEAVTQNARRLFFERGDSAHAAWVLGTLIEDRVDNEKYDGILELMNEYETKSGVFDKDGHIAPHAVIYYYYKGRVAFHYNELESAERYFRKLFGTKYVELAYKGLLALYTHKHIPDSMGKYALLYAEANDSSFLNMNVETVQRMSSMYEYGRYQNEARIASDKLMRSESKRYILVIVVILLFMAIATSAYIVNRKNRRTVEHINRIVGAKDYYKTQLTIAESERKEEAKRYEEYVSAHSIKEEELAELRRIHIEKQKEYETEIDELQRQLDKFKEQLETTRSNMLKESFYETDIYSKFKDYCTPKFSDKRLSRSDWRIMENRFCSYYESFIDEIKSHRVKPLTEEQIRMCMLLHLGFKEADIALLMDINYPRVNKLKIQINEKLFAASDAKSLRSNLAGIVSR